MAISKSKRTDILRANDARVDAQTKPLGKAVAEWLENYAEEMARRTIRDLKAGRLDIAKATNDKALEKQLLDILAKFGLRQIGTSGKATAQALDGEWLQRPGLLDDVIAAKEIQVTRIVRRSLVAVRRSLSEIFATAAREKPTPSVGAIARRIAAKLHGPPKGRVYAFSPERAALVARTESVQNEGMAIDEGMVSAGVAETEWIARTDGKSGDRHHERMNGKRAKIGEKFTTPLGNKLRYPGDPRGPIKETAN